MGNKVIGGIVVTAIVLLAGVPVAGKLAGESRRSLDESADPTPGIAGGSSGSAADGGVAKVGVEVTERLVAGDTAGVAARFDAAMKAQLPPAKIVEGWNAVIAEAGAFKRQVGAHVERLRGYDVAVVTCEFERGNVDVQVSVDNGVVVGLYATPVRP